MDDATSDLAGHPALGSNLKRSGRKRKQINNCELDAGTTHWNGTSPFKKVKTIEDESPGIANMTETPSRKKIFKKQRAEQGRAEVTGGDSIGVSASDALSPKRAYKKSRAEKAVGELDGSNEIIEGKRKKRYSCATISSSVAELMSPDRFRQHAPQSYLEIKARALTQRFTVLNRERCGTDEVPEEKVTISGSTGNVYIVDVGLVPKCDCPHARKGNQCKHIIYVMLRVLKAPEQIGYQLALLPSELRDLFKNAPPIPKADADADSSDGNRKEIEGECPICYMEFEPHKEVIVYCRAACGNNVHKDCMDHWMHAQHGKATCPYCRSTWEGNGLTISKVDLQNISRDADGYVNIASQLGLSGERGKLFMYCIHYHCY